MTAPNNGRDKRNAVVVRLTQPDLQTVEEAVRLVGNPSLAEFLRAAGVILAKSLVRAAADGGFRAGELRLDEVSISGSISIEGGQ